MEFTAWRVRLCWQHSIESTAPFVDLRQAQGSDAALVDFQHRPRRLHETQAADHYCKSLQTHSPVPSGRGELPLKRHTCFHAAPRRHRDGRRLGVAALAAGGGSESLLVRAKPDG